MYRISAHVLRNAARLLRCSRATELRVVCFSRSPAPLAWYDRHREREPCPPPPPPELPPLRVNKFLLGTGIFLFMTAGFIVYAKQYPEVRDWLSINLPWFDDLIAVVYEENKPIGDSIADGVRCVKKCVEDFLAEPPEECQLGYVPPPKPVPIADVHETDDSDDDDDDDDEKDEEEGEGNEEDDSVCEVPPPPVFTQDMCELEACLKETAEDVINNYMTARDYCIYYNDLVRAAMFKFSRKRLKHLLSQQEERIELIEKHICLAEEANKRFCDLSHHINCSIHLPKDRQAVSQQKARDFVDQIDRIKIEFEQENQKALKYDRHWKLVECLMDMFWFETSAMYPELNYESDHPVIYGNVDLLLMHSKKYVDMLSTELEDRGNFIGARIDRAYDAMPVLKGKEKERDAKVQAALKKARADYEKEINDRLAEIKKENDAELKARLAERQTKYEEDRETRVVKAEAALTTKLDKMVKEKVDDEKRKLQVQLNTIAIQVRVVENKLEERLIAERESKRAQQLYTAGSSLLAATKKGEPRINVAKELEIIRKASIDDKLVRTVLDAIPGEVRDKGLVPEAVIKDKYYSMEDIAMKVAMVEAEGAPLPLYAFSYLQSLFLFMKPSNIPQAELDNPPKEPFEHMDTFDLLQRARYFMAAGNLATAVRYVDALKGASRGAAEAWYQSANALLQTRQAAEAIIAHAAALSLQYL